MRNDLEKSLETVAKGAGVVFIGFILGSLLGMVNQSLLGRILGVEPYGLFNLAFSIATIAVTLAVFGLFGALSRFIPFYLQKGENGVVKSAIRFSLGFVLITSILIGIILYIFSDKISVDIFHATNLDNVLKYFLIGLPLIALPRILEAVIRGFKAIKYKLIIFDIGKWLVRIFIFIPFIFIGYELFGAVVAVFTALIFTIFTSMIVIRKKLFQDYFKYRRVPIAKELLSFSWPLALTGLTFLFVEKTDILLLGYYQNPMEVGIYMPALIIAQFLIFVGASCSYIFLPVVSELFAKGKRKDLESLFKSVSKWMFLVVLPLFMYILLFPKEIITLLYGLEYLRSYLPLVILAFGISMTVFTGLTGSILVGGGHTKLNLACEIIAAITNVSLNIVLIPIYGIIGAAIGTSASYFMLNIFSLTFVYKTEKMHPYNKDYLKIIIVGIIVTGIIYIIKIYITDLLYWPILMMLLGFLMVLLYFGLLLPTRFLDKNDKIILKAIERKLGFKFRFLRKFF